MTKQITPKPWETPAAKSLDEITPLQIIVTGFLIMAVAFIIHFAFDVSVSLAYLAVGVIAVAVWYFARDSLSGKSEKDETKKVV